MIKKTLPFLLLFFVNVPGAPLCDCPPQGLQQTISDASLIIKGTVLGIREVSYGSKLMVVKTGWSCRVKTEAVFKGTADSIAILFVKNTGCDQNFKIGKEYLFYATKGSNDIYHVDRCSKLYADAADDLKLVAPSSNEKDTAR